MIFLEVVVYGLDYFGLLFLDLKGENNSILYVYILLDLIVFISILIPNLKCKYEMNKIYDIVIEELKGIQNEII